MVKKFNFDGVEYEADEGFINVFKTEKKRADAAEEALKKSNSDHQAAVSKMEAERDTAKDRADKAEKELEKAKADALDEKRLDELVAAKLSILDAADRAGVEVKKDMSDADIKRAVILSVFPTAKLDGKDEAYLSARFDSAVETLESHADGESRVIAAGEHPKAENREDSASARQRMIDYNNRRSRGSTKEEE